MHLRLRLPGTILRLGCVRIVDTAIEVTLSWAVRAPLGRYR